MKKVKLLVADDDCRVRSAVKKIIEQNFRNVEIVAQTDSVKSTIESIWKHKPDIALLDIHLADGTAIEVVKRTIDHDYKVIFMSAYQEYALDDIRFASIDFIYKPLDISELLLSVDNVLTSLIEEGYKKKIQAFFNNTDKKCPQKQIVFKAQGGIVSVSIDDVVYGESVYRLSSFYIVGQGKIEASLPLRRYESMLNAYGFVRCHPRYVVNLSHVESIDYASLLLVLSNGDRISFERRRLASFEYKTAKPASELNSL